MDQKEPTVLSNSLPLYVGWGARGAGAPLYCGTSRVVLLASGLGADFLLSISSSVSPVTGSITTDITCSGSSLGGGLSSSGSTTGADVGLGVSISISVFIFLPSTVHTRNLKR